MDMCEWMCEYVSISVNHDTDTKLNHYTDTKLNHYTLVPISLARSRACAAPLPLSLIPLSFPLSHSLSYPHSQRSNEKKTRGK